MYSGTTLTKYSGRVMGAHQKIDHVARRQLTRLLPDDTLFPNIRNILQFEGRNGPDGIKLKSPAKDEPWHFYSPFNDDDSALIGLIRDHYDRLVTELKSGNQERTAFEAAWLAHALVDGLTPAHHYPFEEKLVELMGGRGLETRTSVLKKNIIHGSTTREWLSNNWKMWGPKGLRTAHGLFEIGIASLIKPLSFGEAQPSQRELAMVHEIGLIEWFKRMAREVAVLDLYDRYTKRGWTPKLAYQVRHKLGPTLVQTVTLAWYSALCDAKLVESKKFVKK